MEPESGPSTSENPLEKIFHISCNWKITNDKSFHNAITTAPSVQGLNRTNLDDVVSLGTCISLTPADKGESCLLEIKSLTNRAISRITVVSECSVLEFFKQCGEYADTVFAEFIDDFDGSSPVYIAETAIAPASTEAAIKFTKMESKATTMWIYGIKLYLTEIAAPTKADAFNYDVIKDLLSNCRGKSRFTVDATDKMLKTLTINNDRDSRNLDEFLELTAQSKDKETTKRCAHCATETFPMEELKRFIDTKFYDIEARLSKKMIELECRTSQNLEAILTKLDLLIDKRANDHS